MLAEQAEVMLQLGMDAEGAQMRAKMQSAALLSDMESFKAANPGSVLADFVRWHSPRDWDSEKVCTMGAILEIRIQDLFLGENERKNGNGRQHLERSLGECQTSASTSSKEAV